MPTTRAEMRDNLIAALEASPELPHDSREHLADVFLDELDAQYVLVPRGDAGNNAAMLQTTHGRRISRYPSFPLAMWPLMFLLPFLLIGASVALHAPFFLFAIVLFIVMRRWGLAPWSSRRAYWR